MTVDLAILEAVVDASEVADSIEALLPLGVRPRQLTVRTLLVGMLAAAADGRPGHLTRVHAALAALGDDDQSRLGVTVEWPAGTHRLTYRQVEYTFGRVADAVAKNPDDGQPCEVLAGIVDRLLEASIPAHHKGRSTSLAVDWTDHAAWGKGPHPDGRTYDPEASWGHRRSHALGEKDEVFYGYYLTFATMIPDEAGPAVPELVRRATLTSCKHDPVPQAAALLARLPQTGIALGDVVADTGYANRIPVHWALPLRALGAKLVTDLHPADRGPKGTWSGAICANGNLYCPATPVRLLTIAPLPRGANPDAVAAHDNLCDEAARYKLGPIAADDADGYHRCQCPAAAGKLRCPLQPTSLTLDYPHPEIGDPPQHPPICCTQQTITIPPTVNAKTRQKHDYPGPRWRKSYRRRTGVERSYATIKDPAATTTERGWNRLAGLAPILLFLAATITARNLRVAATFDNRQTETARRAERGLPPRARKRRRTTLTQLAATAPP